MRSPPDAVAAVETAGAAPCRSPPRDSALSACRRRSPRAAARRPDSAVSLRAISATGLPRMISRPLAPSTSDSTVSAAITSSRPGMAFLLRNRLSMCGIARLSVNLDQCNQYVPVIVSAWISRDEVLRLIGLKPQTLYAYVSRRLIAAHPTPPIRGAASIRWPTPNALLARRVRGRRAAVVAESAISWGEAYCRPRSRQLPLGGCSIVGATPWHFHPAPRWRKPPRCCGTCRNFRSLRKILPFTTDLPPVEAALSMLAAAAPGCDPTQGRARASLVVEAAMLLRYAGGAHSAPILRMASGRRRLRPRLELQRARRRGDPRRPWC